VDNSHGVPNWENSKNKTQIPADLDNLEQD